MLLTQNQNVEDKQVYCSTKKGYRNKASSLSDIERLFCCLKSMGSLYIYERYAS